MNNVLVEQIETLLPQTQCGKCGYAGCLPYAQAISQQQAGIDQCPPGGEQTMRQLADLLSVALTITPQSPKDAAVRYVAVIDEAACIGCTKCLPPCPVDAIIGAAKYMHTVIATHCTGCELCIAPCPMNCISMEVTALPVWSRHDAEQAKQRFINKNQRIEKQEAEKATRLLRQKQQLEKLKKQKLNIKP